MAHNWGSSNRKSRLPGNWQALRKQVLERDGWLCQICRVRPATIADHIQPMTDDHRLEALQGVCDPCHRQKTAREGAAARAASPNAGRKRPPEDHPGLVT
ncbi:HNH endonuclease [Streptomyces sp. NPDC087440]|uniref:HNH endonuclease n=1 Tax=Streptomyces sp. NPDC087440 TaxID=3365790 RepID=UPI0038019B30